MVIAGAALIKGKVPEAHEFTSGGQKFMSITVVVRIFEC